MTTTINNKLRVYQVITSTGSQVFCNIDELNNVCANLGTHAGYFKIYHFWDNKPKLLSRKKIDLMFEGSQLKREFNY
jgi:hypothetical protein